MVELVSSLAINITLTGHNSQHHLHGSTSYECRPYYRYSCSSTYLSSGKITNKRCAKSYALNIISMFEEIQTSYGIAQPNMRQREPLFRFNRTDKQRIVPHKVASVESGSVCEEDSTLVPKEVEFNEISLEQKLPPWGNVANQHASDIQTIDADQPLRVSKRTVILKENKLHFLEERDEEILSKRILSLSRSNKFRSALELYRSMKFSGLRPNAHACNSLLSCFFRNGMLDDALSIFKFMKTSEITTGHTYSLIFMGIANEWGCDAALDTFEEWVEKSNLKKHFDAVVYNTIISVCGKENNWLQAEKVWRILKDNGYFGTAVTYRLLVCIFVRCDQNELALDAYQEMVQSGLEPCDDVMHAIIGACAKEEKWDLALSVFKDMLNRGLKPNLIACNALINSLGKAGNAKLAFKVYGLMKSLGHTPDAYTWNALLGSLYRANQHADTLWLFECIQKEQSSALNLHLYNTALMSCQRLGLWDKALQLLWQMEASGLSISTASYNLVIGACEVARRPKVALQVYEHMVHQNCTPDTFTLLSLIRSCVWGSLWEEIEEILNQDAPNGSLYNAAIQGLCLRGKTDSAKKLYMKMRESDLKPDGKTRALMLQKLPEKSVRQRKR